MRSKITQIGSKYFSSSTFRWALVGLSTTTIDYLIFISLYATINSVFITNFVSVTVSTLINYYCHHYWTFKSDQSHSKSGIKYIINLIFWWFISTSIIKILILLKIDPKISKLIPLFIIAPINYLILNKIIFKKSITNSKFNFFI